MAKSFILQVDEKIKDVEKKKLREFLSEFENRYEYLYDEPFGSFDYKEMLDIPVEDCNINLGIKGRTVLGFRFQYSKEYKVFRVRVLSPCSTEDWKVALDFMRDFSHRYNAKVVGDKWKTYEDEDMENFDFKGNILEGLEHIKEMFGKYNMEKVRLGTVDIVTIDRGTLGEILSSEEPVEEFDRVAIENSWNIDSRPEQRFYISNPEENEKGVFGYYLIPFGKDFTLKISPGVEPRNHELIMEYGELQSWFVEFQRENGDFTPPLDYYFIINNLPLDKIKYFGYDNLYCKPLDEKEVQEIYDLFREKIGYEYNFFKNDADGGKFFDDYRWHYAKVLKKGLSVGRLTTLNHLAFILRFAYENNLVSDYFKKYYGFVKEYIEIEGCRDLREVILYSMNGRLGTIIFNKEGKEFLKELYEKYYNGEKNTLSFVQECAARFLDEVGDESFDYKEEEYLFTPYREEYYKLLRDVFLDRIYKEWKMEKGIK